MAAFFAHFANSPATAAWVAASLLHVPFGLEGHGFDLEAHPRLLSRIVRDAVFCTTVSEAGRLYLRERLGEELAQRFHLVRCGVDAPERLPTKGADFRILAVGRLRRGKGFPTLLSALAHLAREGVACQCRIVGDGPAGSDLYAQAKREDIADRIAWLGMLPRPRVLEEMAAAHVLALPLLPVPGEREGLPVVVLEAMAHGAAVVTTPLYGIPEVVRDGDTGLLVPPGDAPALAAALRRLVEDAPLRERLAQNAFALARRDFNRDRTYRRLARHIAEMLET
ncbi:glycosyltransferase family 4 protein [bacterium]|nr:glycosyltransferase family 4 protein [bacterium]